MKKEIFTAFCILTLQVVHAQQTEIEN